MDSESGEVDVIRIQMPNVMRDALPIIEALLRSGFEAVFVGGAVRDTALGLEINDVDIATSALPEQVLALFPHCIATGLQHGTVTVMHQKVPYEVTTYRLESAYEDHRRPESVQFITHLDGDLLRRDFTMNAMAMKENGELYDPYGGMNDLDQSLLRCVGDANARFQEDALRMLRAVRFIAAYKLIPAFSAWRSLIRHRALLAYVAMERVQAELDKLLASDWPERGLAWLTASGLLLHTKEPLVIAGKLNAACCKQPDWTGLAALARLDERWAYLFIILGIDTQEAKAAMGALRFSNSRRSFITDMMAIQAEMSPAAKNESDSEECRMRWLQLVLRYGEDRANSWLLISDAARKLRYERTAGGQLEQLRVWLRGMPVKSIKELNVNGRELQTHLNKKAGPWMSELQQRLLLLAAKGELANEKEALLEWAAQWNEEVYGNE